MIRNNFNDYLRSLEKLKLKADSYTKEFVDEKYENLDQIKKILKEEQKLLMILIYF